MPPVTVSKVDERMFAAVERRARDALRAVDGSARQGLGSSEVLAAQALKAAGLGGGWAFGWKL